MLLKSGFKTIVCLSLFVILLLACDSAKKKSPDRKFQYQQFKDSIVVENKDAIHDSINIFDSKEFTPGVDSIEAFLIKMDTSWHRDALKREKLDTLMKQLKNTEKLTPEEKEKFRENIRILDSFLLNKNDTLKINCRENECPLYVAISKSKQLLYLYIENELADSFPVSTGMKKYTTPAINQRPSGPVFTKYTSRKFPGGNYKGLGNMPYAVFVRGGYAIHGTTPGNFSKLGTVASHGCIRLHPDNARIFYELVKLFGISNTWVTVRDSL